MRLQHISCAVLITLSLQDFSAQAETKPLTQSEAVPIYKSIGDRMEATSMAAPELAHAGAPLLENVRQATEMLQVGATRNHLGVIYKLLLNAKIYVQIAETVPRANPFSSEVQRQLAELRIDVDEIEQHFRVLLDVKEERLRNADRDNLARYAEANATLGPPSPEEPRVVFLGDSITDGWTLNQYFPGRDYVNRGISGQITSQMLARMKADVLDLEPEVMVLLAGTNDIARGISQQTIQTNLSLIADLAVAHGVTPVFASILPVSDYHKTNNPNYERTPGRPPATILALNQWIADMCGRRGFVYLDYFAKTVDPDGYLQADLAADGLHPDGAGYQVMAPLAHDAIMRALESRKSAPRRKRFGIF